MDLLSYSLDITLLKASNDLIFHVTAKVQITLWRLKEMRYERCVPFNGGKCIRRDEPKRVQTIRTMKKQTENIDKACS